MTTQGYWGKQKIILQSYNGEVNFDKFQKNKFDQDNLVKI